MNEIYCNVLHIQIINMRYLTYKLISLCSVLKSLASCRWFEATFNRPLSSPLDLYRMARLQYAAGAWELTVQCLEHYFGTPYSL